MPNRQQPRTLRSISLWRVNLMVRSVGFRWMQGLLRASRLGGMHWFFKTTEVQGECSDLRAVLAGLPIHVGRDLVPQMLQSISQIVRIYSANVLQMNPNINNAEYLITCLHIIKSVLLPCVDILTFKDIPDLQTRIQCLNSMYCLPNLTVIKFPPRHGNDAIWTSDFINSVQYLKHLRELDYFRDCNDDIIRQLSWFCPRMSLLRVRQSTMVTNACIGDLVRMKNLVLLDLTDTSVTTVGYIHIHNSLPKLWNLFWRNLVENVLTFISSAKLSQIICCDCVLRDTELLVTKCPNIRQLSLCNISNDLTNLEQLVHLEAIRIMSFKYGECNTTNFFKACGHRLLNITLRYCLDVRAEDIITFCGSVQTVFIEDCTLSDSEMFTNAFSPELPHFSSVKRLQLTNNNNIVVYLNHCKFYINLEVLSVTNQEQMTDNIIKDALDVPEVYRGFKKLKGLGVIGCGHMSMDSVWLLIEHCKYLTDIESLSTWVGVTFQDFQMFQRYAMSANIATTIRW